MIGWLTVVGMGACADSAFVLLELAGWAGWVVQQSEHVNEHVLRC